MFATRAKAKLTQAELAKRMGTTQSVVARIESGRTLPSIKTLYSYAKAVGAKPTIRLDQI
ncbi:MAG: helix-turn-helix transcriptional regulator [Orrella sp.]